MTAGPDWPTPGHVTPRSSSQPPGSVTDPTLRETELLIERVAARGALTPRPDWLRSVHERITREPAPTPARRFVRAIVALSPRAAAAAFMASISAVTGRGRIPAVVRAQALAVVLLTVVSVATVATAGAMVLDRFNHLPSVASPTAPVELPDPSPTTTSTRTAPPRVIAGDDPTPRAPSGVADPAGSVPSDQGPGSDSDVAPA